MMQSKNYMCIISTKTITTAQLAKKVLKRYGIYSDIVSIDPSITKNGCSVGLSFICNDFAKVRRLLDDANISYGEVSLFRE